MVKIVGGHSYPHKKQGTSFCLHKCGCWEDCNGFGSPEPERINPIGECPKAPIETRLQVMLADPNSHL